MSYAGRIAPSPTGYLHLGHARTFWVAHQRALAAQGTLLFRSDDLDTQRCRPEFAAAMVEDLVWLGIQWQGDIVRESERLPLYRTAFETLRTKGAVYACKCSRKDLQAIAAPHAEEDDEPLYPGTCRDLALHGDNMAWRFRVSDGEVIEFIDKHCGPQRFVAGDDFGDFLILRRDGIPSYQLASVVDDEAMQITEVVRGRDLLKSTARQILLQRALNYRIPAFYHCNLMTDANDERLAKRDDALSLRTLRQQGVTPIEIVNGYF